MEIRWMCGGTIVSRSEAHFTLWTGIVLTICNENNEKKNTKQKKSVNYFSSKDTTLSEVTLITCYIDD